MAGIINQRSSGLINSLHNHVIHILGCGAIGSAAATQLARMGADRFVLYDLDKVEVQNVGVSYYIYQETRERQNIVLSQMEL